MGKVVAILAIAAILSGCTSCRMETFFKAESSRGSGITTESDGRYALVSIGDDALLRVGAASSGMQLDIRVKEGIVFRLVEPRFEIVGLTNMAIETWPIPRVEYTVFCTVSKAGTKSCTSSEASPVQGPIDKREGYRAPGGTSYTDFYSFDARLPFKGERDSFAPPMELAFSRTANWREYRAKTANHVGSPPSDFVAVLSDVTVDDKRIGVPRIRFKLVTEEVCRQTSF